MTTKVSIAESFAWGSFPTAALLLTVLGARQFEDGVANIPPFLLALIALTTAVAILRGITPLACVFAVQNAYLAVIAGLFLEPYGVLLINIWPAFAAMSGAVIGWRYSGGGPFTHAMHAIFGFLAGLVVARVVAAGPPGMIGLCCLLLVTALAAVRMYAGQEKPYDPDDDNLLPP